MSYRFGFLLRSWRSGAALLAALLLCASSALYGALPAAAQSRVATPARALANTTLIRNTQDGRVYFIWNNQRHWITTPATLAALGYSFSAAHDLSPAAVGAIPQSNAIGLRTVAGGLTWPLAPITSDPVTLLLNQPSVSPGGQITVTGSGFSSGEQVAITAPNLTFSVTADNNGGMQVTIPVPQSVGTGLHHLYMEGTSSQRFGLQVFYVLAPASPTLTLQPSSAAPGSTIIISGSGFGANEDTQFFLGSGAAVASSTAGGVGGVGPAALAIPGNFPLGPTAVLAYGTGSHRFAFAGVTVVSNSPSATPSPTPQATVVVIPNPVFAGSQAALSGSGFAAGELLLVRFNGSLIDSATTDAYGNLAGMLFVVPAGLVPGTYPLTVTGTSSGRVAILGLAVQPRPPVAVPHILVSPAAIVRGGTVTVAGTGFLPGEIIALSVQNSTVENVIGNAQGSFSGVALNLSTLPPGSYAIEARGLSSARTAGTQVRVTAPPAVVVAHLSLRSSTVAPRKPVDFSGVGFNPGETVILRISGQVIGSLQASRAGTVTGGFLAPQATGSFPISATGASSGRTAVTVLHVVAPVTASISLHPARGHRGALVTVDGSHFAPGEIIVIRFAGTLVQAAQAAADGHFSGARFTVPGNAAFGVASVTATGARSGRVASSRFTVTAMPAPGPHLSVTPTRAHRGDQLTLNASGFFVDEIVLVRFHGALLQAVVTGRAGGFHNLHVTIPLNTPFGSQPLSAQGARSGRSVTVRVLIVPKAKAHLSVAPAVVSRGRAVSVHGTGFGSRERVRLTLHGTAIGTLSADAYGAFTARSVVIPADSPLGYQTLTAHGLQSGRTGSTTLRILAAPQAGISVSPATARRGGLVWVSGHGFQPGEVVLVRIDGRLVQAGTANRDGNFFHLQVRIPTTLPAGTAVVEVTGGRSGHQVRTLLRVL